MTVGASLITPVVRRPIAADSGPSLLLEQQPWDADVGKVTRLDLVKALAATYFDQSGPDINCGVNGDGSAYDSLVFVYPSPHDTPFLSGMTNGSSSAPVRVELAVREAINFRLDASATLRYPVLRHVGQEWAANVWDITGAVIAAPTVNADGQEISIIEPVYGALYVDYITVRFVHNVTVTAREDEPNNVFQSVFYAWCDGDVKLLQLDAPDSAEAGYAGQYSCGGSNLIVNPPDDPDAPPTVDGKNKEIYLSYCEDF